jgi:hypothetical protein
VTGPAGRWELDVRPRAQRQPARLPEKIAAAAAEFITGPLLDNRAVSAIRCVMNTPGSIPPAVDLTGACVTGSTRTAIR